MTKPPQSTANAQPVWQRWHFWAFFGFVLVLSYLTYFHRYWYPPYVFWDENYHIASAQKYLHGVFFMEQHPPLGKMLVALGEWMFHPNALSNQFLGTDYGTDFAQGFSFVGYRFFSALLGWLTAPVLFLAFYVISKKNPLNATLLSFLYIFDNALIVHLRGAMLEGPLLFFASCLILFFLTLWEGGLTRRKFGIYSALFGVAMGCILTTKVLGLIFILLVPALLYRFRRRTREMGAFVGIGLAAFLVVYCSAWYTHFALGKTVNPVLPDQGYYQASETQKKIINAGKTGAFWAFPVMLRDSLKFVRHYNNGAPRLDLCKIDENGSPFFFWPLGARSINYRWETPEGQIYRYLFLQVNPAVWWSAFAGVLMALFVTISSVFFPIARKLREWPLLLSFLGMYVAFMLAVSKIDRVMYLYHYFLPLLMSFFILAIIIRELQTIGPKQITEQGRTFGLIAMAALIFIGYQFYRPLTYYEPMANHQVERRAFFPLWDLRCVNCENRSLLVIPVKEPE